MSDARPAESFVLFELSGSTWGVRSQSVQSVEMAGDVTPVPNALPFVEGVTLTRGQVIPRINLRVRFGFPRISRDLRSRMLVVRVKDRILGMLVDSAREFVSIPLEAIQPPAKGEFAGSSDFSASYLEGIATLGTRLILILNLEKAVEAI